MCPRSGTSHSARGWRSDFDLPKWNPSLELVFNRYLWLVWAVCSVAVLPFSSCLTLVRKRWTKPWLLSDGRRWRDGFCLPLHDQRHSSPMSLCWCSASFSTIPFSLCFLLFRAALICLSRPAFVRLQGACAKLDRVNNDAIRQECQKREVEVFGELKVERGAWQTAVFVFVFNVLIDLPWNIKMAFNFSDCTCTSWSAPSCSSTIS